MNKAEENKVDIGRLESRIEAIILRSLHWQDLFQTRVGILNDPMSEEEMKKINDVGVLRYRHDSLFNQRVMALTAVIIEEVMKTLSEESGPDVNCPDCEQIKKIDPDHCGRCIRK